MDAHVDLKEALIAAFEQMKIHFEGVAFSMCEVASLRTVLMEQSVEIQNRYSEILKEEVAKARQTVSSATQVYDDLIAALRADTRWLN
jgi:hypothetical protein